MRFSLIISMRMVILALGLVCLNSRAVHRCGEDLLPISGGELVLRLHSEAMTGEELAWRNHNLFLEIFGVLEPQIEMRIPVGLFRHGAYSSALKYVGAINQFQRTPAGSVYLRMLARIVTQIAASHGAPELAGEIFAHFTNRRGFELVGSGDSIRLSSHSIFEHFRALCFGSFLSVSEISTFGPEAPVTSLLAALNTLSAQLSGRYSVSELVHINLVGGLNQLGLSATDRSVAQGVSFPTPEGFRTGRRRSVERVRVDYTNPDTQRTPGSFFLIPLSAPLSEPLRKLAQAVVVHGDTPSAIYLAADQNVAIRLLSDFYLFERLNFPLIAEANAYSRTREAVKIAGRGLGLAKPGRLPNQDALPPLASQGVGTLGPKGLFEIALAYAMQAVLEIPSENNAAERMVNLLTHVLDREYPFVVTLGDFERAARKYNIPVHFVAATPEAAGRSRPEYPGFKQFEAHRSSGHVPTRALLIIGAVPNFNLAGTLKALGFEDGASNLELLDWHTGY